MEKLGGASGDFSNNSFTIFFVETMTEEQLQAKCVAWYWNEYRFTTWKRMLHCNNNNSHNKIAGNIAKAMGVVAGVSDLELIMYGRTLYIELKLPHGTQSDEQKEFQAAVEERGHRYIIVRTFEHFKDIICLSIGK